MKEVHIVIHTQFKTGKRRLYAFSTEERAKDFISLQKAAYKQRHGWMGQNDWKVKCIAVDGPQ